MAKITGAASEKVIPIKNWLGLHECPDGDTDLKMGEAAVMRNFRVTRDGNLQKRAGLDEIVRLGEEPIKGMWTGYVSGREIVLAVCGTSLYSLWDGTDFYEEPIYIGDVGEAKQVHIFGFADKAYILTGKNYLRYDGTELIPTPAYVPLVAISITPDGAGETLEQVNKLTASRRVWVSPDGKSATFKLPEKGIASVDYIKSTASAEQITGFTADLANGTVTFPTTPAMSTDSYEIGYTASAHFRAEIDAMRYSELFNGSQDTRVFVYGDGSNKTLYSGVDYYGNPSAEYFPDLNVINVGESNTPITSLIRHYSTLVAYKTASTWSIQYGEIALADGTQTAAFYVKPINRIIGNAAPGQTQLVLNSPRSVFGNDIYEWRNNSSYSSNLSVDERQAKRISDRVYKSLSEFDPEAVRTLDNNSAQEYFVWEAYDGGEAGRHGILVHNYAVDAWYLYTGLPITEMLEFKGRQLCGTASGYIGELKTNHTADTVDGVNHPIDCRWESGSMNFGAEYMRKYSATTWLAVKPASHSDIDMTVQTDRSVEHAVKDVETRLIGFDRVNFGKFTFAHNRRPQVTRLKVKAKKFVYYKLILECCNTDATATVTDADIKVRYTGYAK